MINDKGSVNDIEKGFEDLDFNFECDGSQSINIIPSTYRNQNNVYYNYYTNNGICIPIIENSFKIDVSMNGINNNTKIGGIVDGIALENSHKYLIWGFIDQNMQTKGIGVTRWAKSSYTAVTSGTKGYEATFTITNAYQFTVGSKVSVVSTSTDWNYGTVTEIVSNTSIKILMDNRSGYGVNVTTATGTIIQYTKHRPYVVSSSGQVLYSNYYRLLGWIEFGIDDSGSGGSDNRKNIMSVSKWTRKRRFYLGDRLFLTGGMSTTASGIPSNINIGKYLSPIVKQVVVSANMSDSTTASAGNATIRDVISNTILDDWYCYVGYRFFISDSIELRLDPDYNIRIQRTLNAGTVYLNCRMSYYDEID